MNYNQLRKLYKTGELPAIISDSSVLLNKFSAHGFKTISIDSLCGDPSLAPSEAVLITATPSKYPNIPLMDSLKNSATLFIPLLAFAYDDSSINYLIEKLLILDFEKACSRSLEVVKLIQNLDGPIYVASEDCRLTIELGQEVDIFAPKLIPEILKGENISIIQFLEVALTPNEKFTAFNVNGTLLCDGISIAHHQHSHLTTGPMADAAWNIFKLERQKENFPLKVEVVNSEIIAVRNRNEVDLLDRILPFTDEIMRSQLTEVAFGSLEQSPNTDWTINSQLNEPAGGVHLALGSGETGAHIDFISSGAVISTHKDIQF